MTLIRLAPLALLLASAACGGEIATVLTDNDNDSLTAGGPSGGSSNGGGAPAGDTPPPAATFEECTGVATEWQPTYDLLLTEGSLRLDRAATDSGTSSAVGTVAHVRGKYYFELEVVAAASGTAEGGVGITGDDGTVAVECHISSPGQSSCSGHDAQAAGQSFGAPAAPYGAVGDVVGVAVDLDAMSVTYTLDGSQLDALGVPFAGATTLPLYPTVTIPPGQGILPTFGGAFQYGPPAGYGPWDCTP